MPGSVRKRQVFYLPGYDPFPPRRYRELYRKEAALQSQISGYQIALSPREKRGDGFGWNVRATIEGRDVVTEFTVLEWSDIVQFSMASGILGTYAQMLRTAWVYIGSGSLRCLMRLRKGPVIAALYPIVVLTLQALTAILAVFAMRWASIVLLPFPGAGWLGIGFGLLVGWSILRLFRRYDAKFFAYYLMHDYAHGAATCGALDPALAGRLQRFQELIANALKNEVDEVLVVGHSSGAHLGVTVLADLIRAQAAPEEGPKLSFLSLGQVVPMVSFLPGAWQLRRDLAFLSMQRGLTWIDITAPGDGCAFALCDPVSVSGVAPVGKRWPIVFSAAFSQTLSPARWRALKRRYFRLHFQYLCAFDQPKDYDYFRVTAGPLTLSERYGTRTPSNSRIESPVSKYTSVVP
ncbi:MAG: hypothetical protein AAGD04_01865 [Pseudomonadota bacterium]